MLNILQNYAISDAPDTWEYLLHPSKLFFVSSLRKCFEANTLCPHSNLVRWNRSLPIKVNVFSWRLSLDRLPTRTNLNARGIDVHSSRCPVCDDALETSQHLFVECCVAVGLWNMVKTWWGCADYPKNLHSLLVWGNSANINKIAKPCLGVVNTTLWVIWRYRNRVCFDLKPPRKDTLADDIKVYSHAWINHRNRKIKPLWYDWTFDPIKACTNMM
ncbi:reverse transcriptase domain, reverse transcriptase zinc-binding domain protein [Tanacetum coccineum]